jgi:helicase
MDFDALEGYGVEGGVIQVWKSGLGPSLLPIQERAVKAGLLAGRNLIVFAPTSSGKTAIGEMAAIKAAQEGKRVLYLVPLKALAEEKYREFRARYAPLGIDVVVSSRDHSSFDEIILSERYRLAIATFEKLGALLVAKPSLVESIGLVVVDELQMIADPERGAGLEVLLTKIRVAKSPPQIVGLSAVLERCDPLAAWLGAQLIVETTRPVELRKGVLLGGTFHYAEHNSGKDGTEKLFEWSSGRYPDRDYRGELLHLAVRHLAEKLKEPTLVFVPDRKSAVLHAKKTSNLVSLPASQAALEDLKGLDDCEAKDALGDLLTNGVAFHHADLPLAYRELVEKHFRAGAVRVLFCTSTLAMGVNLPARNVLLLPDRWRRDPRYGWISEPLTKMEFENVAGRAARLGYGDPFGRAMIVETSPFEKEILVKRYIRAPFETFSPAMKDAALEEHVLPLLASGLAETLEQVTGFLKATFSGSAVSDRAKASLEKLKDADLIEFLPEKAAVTKLGRAVAARGLRCESGSALATWSRTHPDPSELEILLALAWTRDGEDLYVPLQKREHLDHKYEALLAQKLPGHPLLAGEEALGYEETQAVKKALVLADWIEERPLREIEESHQVWLGSVERLGEEFAWIAEGFVEIASCERWEPASQARLRSLASRLRAGVREDLLPIAQARIPGIGRSALRKLWEAGVQSAEALKSATRENLGEILGRGPAQALHDRLHDVVPAPEPLLKRGEAGPRLVLVGQPRSHARATVLVDGVERLFSRRHFELLLQFADKEWLPLTEVGGDVDTARKEILRLRGRLARALRLPVHDILRSDGQKRYRLLVSIRLDEKSLRKYQPDLAASRR